MPGWIINDLIVLVVLAVACLIIQYLPGIPAQFKNIFMIVFCLITLVYVLLGIPRA